MGPRRGPAPLPVSRVSTSGRGAAGRHTAARVPASTSIRPRRDAATRGSSTAPASERSDGPSAARRSAITRGYRIPPTPFTRRPSAGQRSARDAHRRPGSGGGTSSPASIRAAAPGSCDASHASEPRRPGRHRLAAAPYLRRDRTITRDGGGEVVIATSPTTGSPAPPTISRCRSLPRGTTINAAWWYHCSASPPSFPVHGS